MKWRVTPSSFIMVLSVPKCEKLYILMILHWIFMNYTKIGSKVCSFQEFSQFCDSSSSSFLADMLQKLYTFIVIQGLLPCEISFKLKLHSKMFAKILIHTLIHSHALPHTYRNTYIFYVLYITYMYMSRHMCMDREMLRRKHFLTSHPTPLKMFWSGILAISLDGSSKTVRNWIRNRFFYIHTTRRYVFLLFWNSEIATLIVALRGEMEDNLIYPNVRMFVFTDRH